MNQNLRSLKDVTAECCVTILLNTHRVIPQNEQDPIALKNLVGEAANRLSRECRPELAKKLTEKLEALAASIDHRHNLESLMLFVNEDIAEYTRLTVTVVPRVDIGPTFATRDLIRAQHMNENYFVLVLGRDEARLIEAANDTVLSENPGNFPLENAFLKALPGAEFAVADRVSNLQAEFFNIVDKQVNELLRHRPEQVFLACDTANYHLYQKVADRKEIIMGHLNGNRSHEKSHHIISAVWPLVAQIRRERLAARSEELEKAAGANQVLTDYNDIWRAVNEGRGRTLFVIKDLFVPARISKDMVELAPEGTVAENGVVDDIIDEMVEINLKFGGEAVFLPPGELGQYQGLALTTRY